MSMNYTPQQQVNAMVNAIPSQIAFGSALQRQKSVVINSLPKGLSGESIATYPSTGSEKNSSFEANLIGVSCSVKSSQ